MSVFMQRCKRTGAWAEDCGGNFACENSCDLEEVEVGVLDDLAAEFRQGETIRFKLRESDHVQLATVVGVCWSLPEEPGGSDSPAIIVRMRYNGRTGHVFPDEVIEKLPR